MVDNSELVRIVGSDNVSDSSDVLEEYSGNLSFVPRVRPRCVIKPGSAEEVQKIVTWANQDLTPLVPVSSGPPHFRGGTVPAMGGSVIVDLRSMKKIIRVNPTDRVAMVEPGVTFGELQAELKKAGLSAYMPLSPRDSKSVIGSMLEREPITIPGHHWDCLDPLLCAEIIFGTGDKLRTGEAAGPDPIQEQWKMGRAQIAPFGPGQFDPNRLVSGAQGTIGIITWATLKCRPLPKLHRTFMIPSETIEPLIDLSYQFIRSRLGEHCFIVNDLNLASLCSQGPEEIKALRDILPRWILVVSFEGSGELPEEKVEYQEADFRDMLLTTGRFRPVSIIGGLSSEDVAGLFSRPSDEPYWKLRYKGGFSDIFFLTTLDKAPGFVETMSNLSQYRRFSPEDIGVYIQPVVQGTSCHCEFDLFYDPTNTTELERVKLLVTTGATDLANMGAFFSRPYGSWANIAYSRATETTVVQRKVKKIFDPNNVLNPGKLCF